MTLTLFSGSATSPGLLVTIDGPNASGKTSIASEVERQLDAEAGLLVHAARQPSESDVGALARRAEAALEGRALGCLVAADRHQQLATEIGPALGRGAIVVCDRYIDSSLVLQRIDGVELEFILAINSGILRPDLRVRLLASADVLRKRLAERPRAPGRRFERMPGGGARELAFYADADELLRERYQLPSLKLDTSGNTVGILARQVVNEIRHRLGRRNRG